MSALSTRDMLDEAKASGSQLRIAEAELECCIRAEQALRGRIKLAREILASPALKERHKAAKADLEEAERDLEGTEARRAVAHARYAPLQAEEVCRILSRQQSILRPA